MATTPTYTLSADRTNVNEGEQVFLYLSTTDLPDGTRVDFNFSGTINDADTQWGLSSPYFIIGMYGTANIGVTFLNDYLTEGVENLTATLVNDPTQSITITVNDTSVGTATGTTTGTGSTPTTPTTTTTTNHAPTIPTTTIFLPNGIENTPYHIYETQLLAGFNDLDGDQLSIEGQPIVTNGILTKVFDGWTFTPSPNYSGVVSLNYNVTDGKPNGFVTAPPINFNLDKVTNNPPTGSIIIEGVAKVGTMLSINSTLSDPDGINGAINYQWLIDNAPVANGYNYTVAAADTSKTITVKASYTDMLGKFETMSSGNVMVQAAPTYSLSVDKNNVNEGETVNLTVQSSANFASPNEVVNLMFSGNVTPLDVNGGFIPTSINLGANGNGQISLSFLKDKLTEGTENLTFTLANDPTKSITINVNDPMNNPPTGNVMINGEAKVGKTVFAQNNVQDVDGFSGTPTFQWMSNGVIIYGQTQPNYTLTTNDANKNISVQISYTDGLGNLEKMTSTPVLVQAAQPTYILNVDKFNVNEGETVNVSLQTTNVTAGTMVNFLTTGSIMPNDLSSGFIPNAFNIGMDGSAKISLPFLKDKLMEGSENLTLTLTNDPTKSVTINVNDPMNNAPTGNVMINGEAKVGKTLFAQNNVQDVDGFSGIPTFQWMSNGMPINGQMQPNYTLVAEDANKNISVQISYTDGLGNLEKMASSPLFVQQVKPTYLLNVDKFNANEGDTITLGLQTTNVPAGTEVKFNFGGSISPTDTAAGLNFPSFFVGADGSAKLAVTFVNDKLTEGMENLTATLQNDPNQTVSVNVNDTSIKAVNNPPTGDLVIKGDAKVGQTLFVQNNVQDLDGVGAVNYQWFSNGAIINGKNQQSYTLITDDANKNISVQVNYIDGLGTPEKVSSTPLFIPSEMLPTAKATYFLSVDKFNVNEGDTANFILKTTNVPAGTEVKFNFGGSISNADTAAGLSVPSFFVDADGSAKLAVTFTNDKLTEGLENLTATLQNDPNQSVTVSVNDTSIQTGGVPPVVKNNPPTGEITIVGDTKVGQILTVQNTLKDADGLGSMSYQWLKNGTPISGATQEEYTLTKADLGKAISVTVSYIDGLKNAESKTSDATDLIELTEPTYSLTANKTQIDEGATVTFKLVTTNLPEKSTVDFSFGGEVSDEDITGGFPQPNFVLDANGKATLSLALANDTTTEGDEDLTLTLNDDIEQMVSVMVKDTSITEVINHKPTGSVVIQGTAKVGNILSFTNTLDDADGLGEFNYQWLSNGTAIKNATKETYKLAKTDVGKKISVNVSYIDGLDNAESKNSDETLAIKTSTTINGLTKKGDAGKNKIIGADKNDDLSGLAGADTLLGNAGNDLLDGGDGNDSLDGGNGNDDLTGGDGNDTLLGGSGNDSLDGGKGDDKLIGDAGNDTLTGGLGSDNMDGGAGDDYYSVDNKKDIVTETDKSLKLGGNDTVESSLTYTLGKNVENLLLSGITNNNGTGNELNNQITGNVGDNLLKGMAGNDKLVGGNGADTLDGGLGMDTLIGGADDDTYYMNNLQDKIVESEGGGEDQIIASVNFELSTSPNVEILTLSGAKAITGTGDDANNLLQEIAEGNVANIFDGKAGDDTINGEGGNDTLEGGDGNDVLDGGDGEDTAIFIGAQSDYQITRNVDAVGVNQLLVEYVGNEDLNEGTDSLTNIEILQFADGDTLNTSEVPVTDSNALLILTGLV